MAPGFTVVCVEDDENARHLFQHVIAGLGGTLIEAIDVQTGMAAIREHHPQLVLLDLLLPGKSGWAILDEIKSDPDLCDVPVVVVTIKDQAEEEYYGRRVDLVHTYITKPFEVLDLEAAVTKALAL